MALEAGSPAAATRTAPASSEGAPAAVVVSAAQATLSACLNFVRFSPKILKCCYEGRTLKIRTDSLNLDFEKQFICLKIYMITSMGFIP